jgi:seryl-tRNA synthetase
VVTNINVLSSELVKALNANDDKFDELSAEVEEIKDHVQSTEVKHKTSVSKINALEAAVSQGRTFSVLRSQPSHKRYHQFRGHRPRICYNCRKPGHEARNCDKPNPRMDALKATTKSLSVENVEKAEEEEMCPWELQYQAGLKARNGS